MGKRKLTFKYFKGGEGWGEGEGGRGVALTTAAGQNTAALNSRKFNGNCTNQHKMGVDQLQCS